MKKGFTLAELLGVLVVLALISMIAIPSVASVIKDYKNQTCEIQFNYIIEAAKSWASNNMDKIPVTNSEYVEIRISDLIEYGYLDDDLVNPKTSQVFPSNFVVRITKNLKVFSYTIYDTDSLLTINTKTYCAS